LQALIVIGDKTSHSGTVITCSPFSSTEGKGWARVGDMVSCPKCAGVFPIVEGDLGLRDDGHPVSYHGCKTACGAMLVSSQMLSLTAPVNGPGLGAATSASDALKKGFGHVGAGFASAYEEEPVAAGSAQFRGRFQLVDATTGEAVRGQPVRVRSTGGQYMTGQTDANGYTSWVEREAAELLAFDLVQDGEA
jgi:uncharacterized Zn-binding protein involved in type VI secretion